MKEQTKNNDGLSLIEILVVISVFAVLTVITTNSIFQTLKGARKSDAQIRVRENLNYALSIVERQIRNSQNVTCPSSGNILSYTSLEGVSTNFSCVAEGTGFYLASGSARLTSDNISITNCLLQCVKDNANDPPKVGVSLVAKDMNSGTTVEGSSISIETEITARNY